MRVVESLDCVAGRLHGFLCIELDLCRGGADWYWSLRLDDDLVHWVV